MFNPEKVQALAARRLTEQQIADVLDIDLNAMRFDAAIYRAFIDSVRKGRAKGEAELRDGLYKKAKAGDASAYLLLLRREQNHKD
ncbi:hypothetical protein P2G74_01495 [Cronobacter muytjensii]|uniref:hypothetical protein n=1 Tax=Cronobacter muytjensii TaxID=413501 RepID=UPI002DBC9CDA|nr:hypothetical protein [Cronobacter muytjensii]MEB8638647.1 hypothetical protein [Cronobacter muytjensii]